MIVCSGLTLIKIESNPVKTETYKFSLGIIIFWVFGYFSNCEMLLGLLDTEVVLDLSTLLTVSYSFFMEVIYVLTMLI